MNMNAGKNKIQNPDQNPEQNPAQPSDGRGRFWPSLRIAFSMYSRLPVRETEWSDENMRLSLACFPLVGAVEGLIYFALFSLLLFLGGIPAPGAPVTTAAADAAGALAVTAGDAAAAPGAAGTARLLARTLLSAALLTLFPLWYTGGIHMDGFLDTADALGSNAPRERKLEILKDPHAGAFALISCGAVLLLSFACHAAVLLVAAASPVSGRFAAAAVAWGFVFSRSAVGYLLMTIPNARGAGSVWAFTEAAERSRGTVKCVLTAFLVLSGLAMAGAGAMAGADAIAGAAAAAGSGTASSAGTAATAPAGLAGPLFAVLPAAAGVFFGRRTALREFGGLTGDLCGCTLVLTELLTLAGTAAFLAFFA